MTPLLKDWLNVWATFSFAAAYSGLPQTSKLESFITVVNCHKPLNTVAKCSIFYVCGSPEYISGLIQYHFLQTWFFFSFFFLFFLYLPFFKKRKTLFPRQFFINVHLQITSKYPKQERLQNQLLEGQKKKKKVFLLASSSSSVSWP